MPDGVLRYMSQSLKLSRRGKEAPMVNNTHAISLEDVICAITNHIKYTLGIIIYII